MANQPPEIAGLTWKLGGGKDTTTTTHLLATFLLVAGTLWLIARLAQNPSRSLPPGPRGLPLIGNVLHITDQEWLASPQRRDDYGNTRLHTIPLMPYKARSCTIQVK